MRKNKARNEKKGTTNKHLKSPPNQSVDSPVIVSASGSKEMDKTITAFFFENGISFNVVDSSNFARTKEVSMRFAKQNSFQSYKAPPANDYLGSSLIKHTSQLSNS